MARSLPVNVVDNYLLCRGSKSGIGDGTQAKKRFSCSNYVGLMTSSWLILLCDDGLIYGPLSFTRCGVCH